MRIIDAHIHSNFSYEPGNEFARKHGIEFSWEGLQQELKATNTIAAIVISSDHDLPTPSESDLLNDQRAKDKRIFPVVSIHPDHVGKKSQDAVEALLKKKQIFGIKIYPGYHPVYPSDKRYHPFYALAGKYDVPVIIHTGDTFGSQYLVKYSQPLDVDEIAVLFPQTRFILAHLGNPWVRDAAELIYKNENVYADLSAFCIGCAHDHDLERVKADIAWALSYTARPDKFLYGSDWPLISMKDNVAMLKSIIPKEHHNAIFFENANRVFKLGL